MISCQKLACDNYSPYLFLLQMSNSDKIDNELAERIRVVSGQQSFSFPIWFTNIAVGVRVGKGSFI